MQVLTWSLDFSNGLKLKHTQRSKGAVGVVMGNQEAKLSFEAEIPAEGSEKDYFDMVQTGRVKELRLKVPGKTYTMTAAAASVKFDAPIDDCVKISVELMGKVTSK